MKGKKGNGNKATQNARANIHDDHLQYKWEEDYSSNRYEEEEEELEYPENTPEPQSVPKPVEVNPSKPVEVKPPKPAEVKPSKPVEVKPRKLVEVKPSKPPKPVEVKPPTYKIVPGLFPSTFGPHPNQGRRPVQIKPADECPICMNPLEGDLQCIVLNPEFTQDLTLVKAEDGNCGHLFHYKCLHTAMKHTSRKDMSCPCCRGTVKTYARQNKYKGGWGEIFWKFFDVAAKKK